MKTRDEIQTEITNTIIENNYTGIVIAAMRPGKTKMIIDSLKLFKGSVLWVTDKSRLRDVDIPLEFKKWNGNISNVDIICYQSLHKIVKTYDLIILDECQKVTEKTVSCIKDKYKHLLACTGVLPNNRSKLKLYSYLNLEIIYNLSVDNAVDNKIIAPYTIEIWEHSLDSKIKHVEVKYKDKNTGKEMSFFTTERERYVYISSRIQRMLSQNMSVKFHAINRMRFIGKSIVKERLALDYLISHPNEKILIFCSDIKQAERITPLSYHSKTDDKCFDAFVRNEISHLSVVNMVDTGITFPHIDTILILTTNSSNTQTVQRLARALMYKPDFVAKIVILCAIDTVEKNWLTSALEELSTTNISRISISKQ